MNQFLIYSQTVSKTDSKLTIDTNMLGTWPTLSIYNGKPTFSPDGNYVAYIISNKPLKCKTLVVQSTWGHWKKEISATGIDFNSYFFSSDSRNFIWKNSDTVFTSRLESDHLDTIFKVVSFQTPIFKKGEWIAYQIQGKSTELIVQNMVDNKVLKFVDVIGYQFSKVGNVLVVKTATKDNDKVITKLRWIDFKKGAVSDLIWSAYEKVNVSDCVFDKDGIQIAFMVQKFSDSVPFKSIWYYRQGMEEAVSKADDKSSINSSLFIKDNNLIFSENGRWLFLRLQEPIKKESATLKHITKVDIWSYKDNVINPNQAALEKSQVGVIDINGKSGILCLTAKDEDVVTNSFGDLTSDYVVIKDNVNVEMWWQLSPQPTYWVVSLKNGTRKILKKNAIYPLSEFSFSPLGGWLVFWDSEKDAYFSYNLNTGHIFNITQSLPDVLNENSALISSPIAPVAGWFTGDTDLLIYDRFDLWKIDPMGKSHPINLTHNYGRKNHIKLRLVYEKDSLDRNIIYSGSDSVLLTGFNTINKYNGFFKLILNGEKNPVLLTIGPYTYYRVESQKGHFYAFDNGMQPLPGGKDNNRVWMVKRQSSTEYPNYFVTRDFKEYVRLTDLQPQRPFNWLTTELFTWTQTDGTLSQGVLYKPENFDSLKKYPIIFNYYEKLSHRLYEFPMPGLTADNINIPWFVSRGYLVFTPDIYYSLADKKEGKTPGESAVNSVVSAAIYFSKFKYVDSKRMAIQGHSFGAMQTSYIVTHSNMFAAASEVAGTTDQISAYLTLAGPKNEENYSKQNITEAGQGRLGTNPWKRLDIYIRNSSVLTVNKVTTPLLIVHNKNDESVQWRQGVELYMAMRRLHKKCWMLQYDASAHALSGKDALDYTIRLTQFFDHYLKDLSPPKWMTESTAERLYKAESDYEIDISGRKP